MKRIMKQAVSLALAAALVVSGFYYGGTDSQAAKKAKKITMNSKNVNVKVGGKFSLKVKKVTPKKASKAVTYKTSNKKIATVTKKGVITGKKVGKATITVTSKTNKKVKAKVTVTVRNNDIPAASPTPVVTPPAATTAPAAPTNAVVPTATPTNKPAKTTRPPKTPTPIPTEKPKAETPSEDVLDVMAISQLVTAEGIVQTENEDGSVTLDFTGTTYKGARWYFIDPATKDAEEPTRKALNLEKYTYVVVEGVNQDGVTLDEEGRGHDLSAQFLDALDKNPDHGGELEIETQERVMFPIKFDLATDNRVNVAAFEIYSLGDAASAKTGPITVKSIKAYKDKETYDKIVAGDKDPDNTDNPDATPTTEP